MRGEEVKMETLSAEDLSKLMEENNAPESVVQLLKRKCSHLCTFSSVCRIVSLILFSCLHTGTTNILETA